jgi:hypothetical protein
MKRSSIIFAFFVIATLSVPLAAMHAREHAARYEEEQTSADIMITYDMPNVESAKLVVLGKDDKPLHTYDLDVKQAEIKLKKTDFEAGSYAYMILDEQERPHKLGSFTVCK